MATLKQIEANRRNAQKSTGPTTEAGKLTVGQNALQHGLLAASPVVFAEEQATFDRLAESLHCEYLPQGVLERILVNRIADCLWRQQRASRIETGMFVASRQKEVQRKASSPGASSDNTVEEYNPRAASLGNTYIRHASAFAKLSRHERHIERSYQAAVRELGELQYARMMQCSAFYVMNMRKFPPLDCTSPKKGVEGHYRSGPDPAQIVYPGEPEP